MVRGPAHLFVCTLRRRVGPPGLGKVCEWRPRWRSHGSTHLRELRAGSRSRRPDGGRRLRRAGRAEPDSLRATRTVRGEPQPTARPLHPGPGSGRTSSGPDCRSSSRGAGGGGRHEAVEPPGRASGDQGSRARARRPARRQAASGGAAAADAVDRLGRAGGAPGPRDRPWRRDPTVAGGAGVSFHSRATASRPSTSPGTSRSSGRCGPNPLASVQRSSTPRPESAPPTPRAGNDSDATGRMSPREWGSSGSRCSGP